MVRAPIEVSPSEADVITLAEGSTDAPRGPTVYGRSGEDNNRRKPKSLRASEGELLYRYAERAYTGSKFQQPPRRTRDARLVAVSAKVAEPSNIERPPSTVKAAARRA